MLGSAGVAGVAIVRAQQNPPVFRAGTELIRVDVQVVTGKGLPVLGLGPDKFEVTVNGRPRQVVSADFVTYDSARITAEQPVATSPRPAGGRAMPVLPRRLFMLTVDERSFLPGYAAGALEAAKGFIGSLQPTDLLGFASFPSGAVVNPTTDRAPVLEALKKTVGLRQLPVMRFNLRVSDIVTLSRKLVEFQSETFNVTEVPARHPDLAPILNAVCPPPTGGAGAFAPISAAPLGGSASPVGDGALSQAECYRLLAQEVQNMFLHLEGEASLSFGVIRGILGDLAKVDGRKTLVLLSGGVVVSDQAGGRPDLGNLGILMAQEAARANVGVYTLFMDWGYLEQFAASKAGPSLLVNLARDSSVNSHYLDTFSTTAGGEMFRISAGNGAFAFNRILSESSAYYLLGVIPDEADRDGRPRRLAVKVKQRGVTIRSREWVVVRDKAQTEVVTYIPPDVAESEAVTPATPAPTSVAATTVASPPVVARAPVPTPPVVAPVPSAPSPPEVEAKPPVPAVPDSPALPFVLTNAGAYVTLFVKVFANVVAEERYLQTTETGRSSRPAVPRRESTSDFLLVTLPGGSREWYRDTFDVNGSPIRDRQQRLVAIFTKPDTSGLARANAILKESATYNIGVDRNINLPTLGLEVLRPDMQRRFHFSGGSIDRTLGAPAYVVAFTETAHPSIIQGSNGADLLTQGRVWVDVKTGYVLKTELALDDINVSGTIAMTYRLDPSFGVAVPVEMKEDYTEADGRRTAAPATSSRFRQFNVDARDEMVPGR